jgi:SAM-dependent methyltransferase
MGSFHHSSDLAATFTAAYRVLKPGGTLLCLDRCHPDTVNDEEVSRMLDVQYSPDFLRSHGYPEGIMLTRRENGEHEYRLREWLAAADEAGFVQGRLISLRHVPLKRAMRGLLSLLPEYLRRYLYRTEDASPSLFFHWLRHLLRLSPKGSGLGTIYLAKKNLTVLTFYKPSGGPDDEI